MFINNRRRALIVHRDMGGPPHCMISKTWLFGRSWDKQNVNFQKQVFGKTFHTMSFPAILLRGNKKN
jgi:hypothetical protein